MVLAWPAFVSVETCFHTYVMIQTRDWEARICDRLTAAITCIWREGHIYG
jgi:hypothetical protein